MLITRIQRWPCVYVYMYMYNNIDKKEEEEERNKRHEGKSRPIIARVNVLLLDFHQRLNHE